MLDNKIQLHFPMLIQQLGWILIVLGALVLFKAVPLPLPVVAVIPVIIGLILSLTFRGTRLDLKNKKIKQYIGVFGIKLGSWKALPELNEIVFTSSSYSQQIHSIVSRKQLNTKEFRAFLKGPGHKLIFASNLDAELVRQEVRTAASLLNLPAIDYTVKPPVKL